MSKTLFWYIFRDLLRIFFLASGALAGIMSFGGLLRPLTKQGLGLSEIAAMVVNLMPAMSTYSLPVAALFATTLVYGKLSSENELTAIRAGGISHLAAATPGIVLGLLVAIVSIVMLCFVVPNRTLQVERIIYSNVARLLAVKIERTHEFELQRNGVVLTAQGARVLPTDPADPTLQTVILDSPLIVTSDVEQRGDVRLRVPREFYSARRATVHIRPVPETDEAEILAQLDDGVSFPRKFASAVSGGVSATQFGPVRIPPQLAEKTKFMDLRKLWELRSHPERAREVRDVVAQVNTRQQRRVVLDQLQNQLSRTGSADFAGIEGERHALWAPNGAMIAPPTTAGDREMVLTTTGTPGSVLRFETVRAGQQQITVDAQRVIIRPFPDDGTKAVEIRLTFEGALVRAGSVGEEPTARDRFVRVFSVPMSPEIAALGQRNITAQQADVSTPPDLRNSLRRALLVVNHGVLGELNARASFAVSCVVLVLVGVSLGMMFKSGHALSAFALSVIPALACILLTTSGQHVLENVPFDPPPGWSNVRFGVAMIWFGNAAVFAVAAVLLHRLQKQ